ncbi:B-cell receptor CD22-like isoform X2 [Takifugu flavidus]|uniref:B-cell receptor CD22-like isoform X2 n=1 Tax=Takifugu flavidus TaxID=433684 RepID=UPI0025447020|nr:B-cell receptor CD22-like isoform X2 [Takifugu flavidus]
MRITNVNKNDSAVYKFMIRTNTGGWRLTGEPGVRLTVPDPVLQVRVSRQESSNRSELTCQSQCGASLYSYIWYKNDQKVDGVTRIHDVSLSINSPARYSCTVTGYESFRSPAVYAPEGPLVSVSPSGEVEEDTTITLNCSSDANPAANYSWYKEGENSSKSSEQNFVITQVTAKDSGRYSCRVWNLLGHSESTVNVTVVPVWPWKLAAIGSGVGIFLIGLTGVFVVLFRKKNTHKKSVETKVDISSKLEEEYTSIHFPKAQTDLCSNVKTSGHLEPKHVEEEDVQYSEISFHRPSSAPRTTGAVDSTDAIYSTVK